MLYYNLKFPLNVGIVQKKLSWQKGVKEISDAGWKHCVQGALLPETGANSKELVETTTESPECCHFQIYTHGMLAIQMTGLIP